MLYLLLPDGLGDVLLALHNAMPVDDVAMTKNIADFSQPVNITSNITYMNFGHMQVCTSLASTKLHICPSIPP